MSDTRETLGGHYIAKELAVIKSYCGPKYDAEARTAGLLRNGATEEEAATIVAREVAKRENVGAGVDRTKLASDLLCAVEFYVIDTEAKRVAAVENQKALKAAK